MMNQIPRLSNLRHLQVFANQHPAKNPPMWHRGIHFTGFSFLFRNGFSEKFMRPFLSVVLLALTSCASHHPPVGTQTAAATVVSTSDLPAPSRDDLYGNTRPYLIGPFDTLTINVFGIPELSRLDVQTDASGRISFPLAGIVEAAGRTPEEIAQILRDRLRGNHVRDPQVTVNLKETVSQVVTVDGEVNEPGLYPVIGQMTLIRAIATARGTTEFAKTNNVVVFRTVGGKKYVALYNLKAIRQGLYRDPELFPNDIVVVSDSQARRIFRDALSILPALTYVLVAVVN